MSKPVRLVLIVLAAVAVFAIIGPVLGHWQAAFGGVCSAIGVQAVYYFTDQRIEQPEYEDEADGDH